MLTLETVEQFFEIADAIPNLFYWKSFDSIYLGVNHASIETLKFSSPNELVGKSDREMPWQECTDEYVEYDNEAIKNGKSVKITFPTLCDGSKLCVLDQKFAIYNRRNRVAGVFANATVMNTDNYFSVMKASGFLLRDIRQMDSDVRRYYYRDIYFTKRQAQVAQRILLGYTCKDIACQLSISSKSVESYLVNIKDKIHASSRKHIVKRSFEYGFIDLLFMPLI